jgi:hypothetical protein
MKMIAAIGATAVDMVVIARPKIPVGRALSFRPDTHALAASARGRREPDLGKIPHAPPMCGLILAQCSTGTSPSWDAMFSFAC